MRSICRLLLVLLAVTFTAQAQSTFQVTLNWKASASSTTTTPGTVNVYRAVGACPPGNSLGTLTYTQLTSTAPAAGPYVDNTVVPATTYCYYIGATISGVSSGPSNTAQAITAPIPTPPTGLTTTTVSVTVSVPPN